MLEYPKCSCLFIWFLIIKFLGDNLRNFSEKKGIKNDYIQKKENEKKKNDDKKSDKKNVDKKSDKKGDDKKSDKKGEQIKTPHHSINSESKSSNKIRKIVSIPKYDGKRLFVKKHIFETTVNEEKDPDKISEYKKLYELRKRGTFGKGYYLKSCRDLKTVNEGP
tara:strand:- start:1612 stop:2103 length:492 start_codon:yes stop_codon:yes gene_type:complete